MNNIIINKAFVKELFLLLVSMLFVYLLLEVLFPSTDAHSFSQKTNLIWAGIVCLAYIEKPNQFSIIKLGIYVLSFSVYVSYKFRDFS